MLSLTPFIDTSTQSSMLASSLPLSFLDTYSLSMSSLGCKAFCIVINFLVFCLSSFRVFQEWSQIFYKRNWSLMRILLQSLVSRSFLVFLTYSYLFLFFILLSPIVWWYLLPIFQSSCNSPSLQVFWFFLNFGLLFQPQFLLSHSSLSAEDIFFCQIPFLYLSWIFSLFVSGSLLLFHF